MTHFSLYSAAFTHQFFAPYDLGSLDGQMDRIRKTEHFLLVQADEYIIADSPSTLTLPTY